VEIVNMETIPREIRERILQRSAYPHTLFIRMRRKPTNQQFKILRAMADRVTCPKASPRSRRAGFKWRLKIDMPTPKLMPLVDQWAKLARVNHQWDWQINELHVAIDYLTVTREDARELQEWFGQHLVEPWRREIRIANVKGSRYTMPKKWRVKGWVSYSDQHASKRWSGQSCCHLEYRAKSAEKVRSLGIRNAVDLVKNQRLWRRLLVVERIAPVRGLGRKFLKRGRAKKPLIEKWGPIKMDLELLMGGRIARIAAAKMDESHPCAQAVRQVGCWFDIDPRGTTIRMNNKPLVPVPWGGQ
jgi:hypothetical protein